MVFFEVVMNLSDLETIKWVSTSFVSMTNNFKALQKDCRDVMVSLNYIDALDKGKNHLQKLTYGAEKLKAVMPIVEEITRWNQIHQKTCSAIHLYMSHNVAYNFLTKTTAIVI